MPLSSRPRRTRPARSCVERTTDRDDPEERREADEVLGLRWSRRSASTVVEKTQRSTGAARGRGVGAGLCSGLGHACERGVIKAGCTRRHSGCCERSTRTSSHHQCPARSEFPRPYSHQVPLHMHAPREQVTQDFRDVLAYLTDPHRSDRAARWPGDGHQGDPRFGAAAARRPPGEWSRPTSESPYCRPLVRGVVPRNAGRTAELTTSRAALTLPTTDTKTFTGAAKLSKIQSPTMGHQQPDQDQNTSRISRLRRFAALANCPRCGRIRSS